MDLQQVLWAITALGAFVAFAGLTMLLRGRGREPGIVAMVVMIGALLCTGGFLLSIPRYRDTSLIAGGAAAVGVLAMLGAINLMPAHRGSGAGRASGEGRVGPGRDRGGR
ncbi:hypothetical protein [Embleya sp. AB8]|uniref:hypothetical protein n=1 Tax=Embleya sp. AB8 TaxID=3156304 RepID=UPI003C792106